MTHAAPNSSVLLCFAVPEEVAPARPTLPAHAEILVSGMGAANARKALLDRLQRPGPQPRLVLTCGFAGGLDPALPRGAVVHDTDPDAGLSSSLAEAGSIAVRFVCSPRVAVTAAEKAQLRHNTGADAVEMESAVIRALCRERRIPSATLRVISDAAADDLPVDFNALMSPNMRLQFGKLAAHLLRSPGSIPGLLRLRRHTVDAARRLATALAIVLRHPSA